jgi:hypothetical protein
MHSLTNQAFFELVYRGDGPLIRIESVSSICSLPVSSAMSIAVSSTVIRPRNASDIQLACLTTVYYSSILNGPVAYSVLNEAYSST